MRRDHPRLTEAGLAVVAIGLGGPAEAAAFARDGGLPYPVLADPEREAYRAYGLVVGRPGQVAHPAAAVAAARALLGGAGAGRPVGDPRQLPGAFVVGRDGTVLFAKPARHAADVATTADLLAGVGGGGAAHPGPVRD